MTVVKFIKLLFLSLMLLAIVRCVEPYEPEVVDYESTLVVDGFFSNSDSASLVTISRSFGYDENVPEFINNAQVSIESDGGMMFELLFKSDGAYFTDPNLHKGEVGSSYRLHVSIPGGDEYISDWEMMLDPTPIGEIEIEYREEERDDPNAKIQRGIELLLSAENPDTEVGFYKWEFEETYQFNVTLPPIIEVVFGDRPGRGQDLIIEIPPSMQQGGICYKTENSKNIIIGSSEGLSENKISKFPLTYITNETSRLYSKYSILVKQFAITKEYHENLRKIAEINQTSGSLFDPIPNEVFGNIKNINDDREPVLGYFGVGGVSEKRIFIRRDDLQVNERFPVPFGPTCEPDTLPLDFKELYNKVSSRRVLSKYHTTEFGTPIGFIISDPKCVYCTANDATHEVPDFW